MEESERRSMPSTGARERPSAKTGMARKLRCSCAVIKATSGWDAPATMVMSGWGRVLTKPPKGWGSVLSKIVRPQVNKDSLCPVDGTYGPHASEAPGIQVPRLLPPVSGCRDKRTTSTELRSNMSERATGRANMARGKKREQADIPKADRKNLRLWAEGTRESILRPHLDGYTAALDKGWRQERAYLKKVCLEFHARVSWETEDHKEPVLDKNWAPAKVTKKSQPLPEEEEKLKRASAGLDPTKDPYAVLLAKLSGLTAPPKARQGFQQWMHENPKDEIELIIQVCWVEEQEKGAEVEAQ
ncbi:hypothetical protein C8R43DRAFT_1197148 [Mycena crocata]|nr:hypothetical protein C8R43DRAFT_1197148 [Mycena crocata]